MSVLPGCKRVLSGIRHYRRTALSAKEKASMDAHAIVKYETLHKMEEIKTYLCDFQDIVLKNGHLTAEQLRAKMHGKHTMHYRPDSKLDEHER